MRREDWAAQDRRQCTSERVSVVNDSCMHCMHLNTADVTDFKRLKVKGHVQLLTEPHFTASDHLPYGITQCFLPPDTSKHTPP